MSINESISGKVSSILSVNPSFLSSRRSARVIHHNYGIPRSCLSRLRMPGTAGKLPLRARGAVEERALRPGSRRSLLRFVNSREKITDFFELSPSAALIEVSGLGVIIGYHVSFDASSFCGQTSQSPGFRATVLKKRQILPEFPPREITFPRRTRSRGCFRRSGGSRRVPARVSISLAPLSLSLAPSRPSARKKTSLRIAPTAS